MSLSEGLLESELFGHEAGAFTGAVRQRKGKFELAAGGTLFLDEVGELSAEIQAKLLRALQERTIDRLGGAHPIAVDIRLIGATNRDLESRVAAGRFREDLYYRLNVVLIRTPPLRDRREDIPALAAHFIKKYASEVGEARMEVPGLSPEALEVFENYDWPGNVRQLGNAIEQAMVLGASGVIEVEDLPAYLRAGPKASEAEPQTLEEAVLWAKRKYVGDILEATGGSHKDAALILGIHHKGMRLFLDRLGL